ncbi:hypothetical protein CDL15_Pgr026187 [Punica granatum]|uniref:Uncharacterized protein n=1 Tax=Punica granatum TaxID=22663 RepID=A0A218VRN6_PUNGR|nr:hypothetical protein CDL15_Pgr026187 [Punica granatum]
MRCDQKPSPSRPPTPHDRERHRMIGSTSLRVMPTHLPMIKRASYMSKHVHINSCTHAQSINACLSACSDDAYQASSLPYTLTLKSRTVHAPSLFSFPIVRNSQQEDSLNTERPQLRQQTSLIQLLGISTLRPRSCSTEQDRKQIRVTTLQHPALFLSIDLCFRISCTFLSSMHLLHLLHRASAPLLGFDPASGFGPTFTALGFGPAFTVLGFGPTFGLRLRIGIRPCIYCIGVPTLHWASGPAFTASRF